MEHFLISLKETKIGKAWGCGFGGFTQ